MNILFNYSPTLRSSVFIRMGLRSRGTRPQGFLRDSKNYYSNFRKEAFWKKKRRGKKSCYHLPGCSRFTTGLHWFHATVENRRLGGVRLYFQGTMRRRIPFFLLLVLILCFQRPVEIKGRRRVTERSATFPQTSSTQVSR